MNTAEYLVKKLEELGVNDFFGLPGDYNFDILYAIENNPNTNWIGCTNELNAGYAADGYARMRGFGALVTTYGVGELSAINAIAGSYAENVPVINIVGVPTTKTISEKRLVHHNFQDVQPYAYMEAFRNVVETVAFLNKDNAKMEIDRVLKIFVKERKPVYIAIPIDIAKMKISTRESDYTWSSDEDELQNLAQKIADKINKSANPIILGDVLIKRFDSVIEFRELVHKTGIPVVNMMMGTGLLDLDFENNLGVYMSNFGNLNAKKYLDESDCILSVGVINSDLNSFGFGIRQKLHNNIAIYGTCAYLDGVLYENIKMSELLDALSEKIAPKNISIEKLDFGYEKPSEKSQKFNSDYIYPRVQEFLRENDVLIVETGIIPQGTVQMKFPKSIEFMSQTLWGSIGWATPAAFGAAIANPDRRVILFTGEGSHQLTAMELGSMLRYGVKPVILVLNNGGYTIERVLSEKPEDRFNDIMQMNYSKFARVFDGDIWSTRVENCDDFDKALRVSQIMDKLCYIELITEPMDMPELTKNLINNFKSRTKTESGQPEEIPENFSTVKKQKDSKFSFGTKIHESLKNNL